MPDLGYSRMISNQLESNIKTCEEHRKSHCLSIEDVESIDCESECPISDTCPMR